MNIKHLLIVAAAAIAWVAGAAEEAAMLAELPAKNLSGDETTVTLHPTQGAILVIGFTRESNESTRQWSERLEAQDAVPVYNVAIMEGAPRFVLGMLRRMLRRAIPEEQHARFLIVEREAQAWRAVLHNEADEDAAHVLRLDADGRVCSRHVGPVTEDAVGRTLDAQCASSD